MSALAEFVAAETARSAPEAAVAFAARLARDPAVSAVLFYGSALRTGELDGVLDFYVLTDGEARRGARGWIERRLWPEIRFETCGDGAAELRAKVAVVPLEVFARAAQGLGLDTTVWTRFVQPSRLLHARDAAARARVEEALASAAVTASRVAALLGPREGTAQAYWSALFRATYAAELRVEPAGRETQVLQAAPEHYDRLLPLAWAEAGWAFGVDGDRFTPAPSAAESTRWLAAWRVGRRTGRGLNAARLVKAALTAPGAARYAAGKLARHTVVRVELTPWRERHPVLAALLVLGPKMAPGLLRRRRRRQADAR